MRATVVILSVACLLGCGRIDSSRSNPNVDPGPGPAVATDDAGSIPAAPRSDVAGTPANTTGDRSDVPPPAPDNTAVNVRDTDRVGRNPKLPIDQKENQADVDLTAKIRQEVLKIDELSINGRNCKIITSDGRVTLRGPVNSASERESIVKIARALAGESNVDDQLEVAPANRDR